MKRFDTKKVRFILVGILNTILSYIIFSCFFFIFSNKELAVIASTFLGLFINYTTYSKIVFKNKSFKKILKFSFAYFFILLMNILHLKITVDFLEWNAYFSQLSTICYLPVISFLLQKYWVFKAQPSTSS